MADRTRPACGKKPQRRQRAAPRTRGERQSIRCTPTVLERRGLSGCLPRVPAVEAPIQGSSLRPADASRCRSSGPSLVQTFGERCSITPVKGRDSTKPSSILWCERWQAEQQAQYSPQLSPWQGFRPSATGIASRHGPTVSLSVLLPPQPQGERAAQPPPPKRSPPHPARIGQRQPPPPQLTRHLYPVVRVTLRRQRQPVSLHQRDLQRHHPFRGHRPVQHAPCHAVGGVPAPRAMR